MFVNKCKSLLSMLGKHNLIIKNHRQKTDKSIFLQIQAYELRHM